MSKLAKAVSSFLLLLAAIPSCSYASAPQAATKSYTTGRILLLPPVSHEKDAGGGQEFQSALRARLEQAGFEVVTADNAAAGGTRERGIAEARRLKANYVFQAELGAWQDAAPMTFRPDYAYLDRAVMYDAHSGEAVWELTAPQYMQKGNFGSYLSLLDEHARAVADSIRAHRQ